MTQGDRGDVEFASHGVTCRGWWYPARTVSGPAPCVVMGHGFGATRDAALEPYARRFAAAGMHVLVFDYRHFGASDGTPRQLVSPRRQLQDFASAVSYVRGREDVDAARVAVWGTSFAGGHALVSAARIDGLRAAVCQCPMMDGLVAVKNIIGYAGLAPLLRLTAHGLLDAAASLVGRTHEVPIVGRPGEIAIMSSPDALAGYTALTPPGFHFGVAARIALHVSLYRPVATARDARCPVLVQICERDSVAPASAAEEVVRRLGPRGEVRRYDIGHFEPYFGAPFERSVADQVDFLQRHLAVAPPT